MKLKTGLSIISTNLYNCAILWGSWIGTIIYNKTLNYTKIYVVSINGIICSGIMGTIGIYTCNLFI